LIDIPPHDSPDTDPVPEAERNHLNVRLARPVTAISFSRLESPQRLIAVGLDKARDHGLYIFAPSRSQTPVVTHGASEAVTSLAFLTQAAPILVAGMASKWLRAFDLRAPSTQAPVHVWATRSLHGITPDPFDGHRFASFGDDGVIRVWDLRRPVEPLLSFSELQAAGLHRRRDSSEYSTPSSSLLPLTTERERRQGPGPLVGLEWSTSRRGMLASAERESYSVRLWQLLSPENPSIASGIQGLQLEADIERTTPLAPPILFCDILTPPFPRAPVSFALTSPHPQRPSSIHIVSVAREGAALEVVETRPPPTLAWSPSGLLAVSRPALSPHRVSVLGTVCAFRQGPDADTWGRTSPSIEDGFGDEEGDNMGWDTLDVDISIGMRRRVNAGYGVDVCVFIF
jgi:WD40 repeat protein